MSTRALVVLEDLRRDEVEQVSRELALLRVRHAEARAAEQGAAHVEALAVRELATARQGFAAACTVFALRAAEAVLSVANNALARAVHRRAQTQLGLCAAERALAQGEARLRAVEVARRAVVRTREQRAADVSLRMERQDEDESDDAFRGQFQRSAGPLGTPRREPRTLRDGALTTPASGPRGGARSGSH